MRLSPLRVAVRLEPGKTCPLLRRGGGALSAGKGFGSITPKTAPLCTVCIASLFSETVRSRVRRYSSAAAAAAQAAKAAEAAAAPVSIKTGTAEPTAGKRRYSSVPDVGRHFDTNAFVTRLEAQSFTREQAEVLVASLSDVISDSVQHMMKNVATKAEQEKTVYTYKVDFAALKGEIQMQEKNEYAMLKSENERLVGEVEKLKQKLREEITRTQAGVRLDISLFRGASRDETSAHELKIKETDARVQADISDLRTEMERVKYSVLSSLIGTITGAGALFLAYMRMFQH